MLVANNIECFIECLLYFQALSLGIIMHINMDVCKEGASLALLCIPSS